MFKHKMVFEKKIWRFHGVTLMFWDLPVIRAVNDSSNMFTRGGAWLIYRVQCNALDAFWSTWLCLLSRHRIRHRVPSQTWHVYRNWNVQQSYEPARNLITCSEGLVGSHAVPTLIRSFVLLANSCTWTILQNSDECRIKVRNQITPVHSFLVWS